MKKSIILMLFWIVCLALIVQAATIQGTVYDLSLKKVDNVLVEINSVPIQRMLVQQGKYQFQVPSGEYTITVKEGKGFSEIVEQEKTNIKDEGIFNVDLFIFPSLNESTEIGIVSPTHEAEKLLSETESMNPLVWVSFLLLLIILASFVVWKKQRKQQIQPEENSTGRIIEILKKEQGRMNQRDLRKHFPFSEAKMSLMLTELEAKGKIERIKKGRGNIIVLR
ncbi:hypothetical protein HZB00_04270 [Candidatus Woesearchaeota archaeon]|nr:hypothetical protein [Candidatus Woesearchaeota archaeon]